MIYIDMRIAQACWRQTLAKVQFLCSEATFIPVETNIFLIDVTP